MPGYCRERLGKFSSLSAVTFYWSDYHSFLSGVDSSCGLLGVNFIAFVLPGCYDISLLFCRLLAEKYNVTIPRSQTLPPEKQRACRNLFKDYWGSLVDHLLRDHNELKSLERQNKRILHTKGELSTERQEKFENVQNVYNKLLANVEAFSVGWRICSMYYWLLLPFHLSLFVAFLSFICSHILFFWSYTTVMSLVFWYVDITRRVTIIGQLPCTWDQECVSD